MAHEHRTGYDGAYDRGEAASEDRKAVVWPAGAFIQGADLNEAQTLARRRVHRVGNMVAKDGDRISGCDIVIDRDAETATLTAGRIYVQGDARTVAGATLSAVPMTGEAQIGVRLVRTVIDSDDDPSLLGLVPGTWAEGEAGAAREIETIAWALATDGGAGEFVPVYLLRDGVVIDQSPPPALTPILAQIARYDADAHGSYIVDGCKVTALGDVDDDGKQHFTIGAGTANIAGWKRIREFAMRFVVPEEPDLEAIAAEPHTYASPTNTLQTIFVQRPPISSVTQVVVTKRRTESVTRGASPGGADPLSKSSVVAIESVVQGGTTYVAATDFVQSGDTISWAPDGAEPAGGSTYDVTYLHNEAVTPTNVTDTTLDVTGGVQGTTVLVSYSSKLPRKDLICLDHTGNPAYVNGVSARFNPIAPPVPTRLLKLATVAMTWMGIPVVVNDGTENYTYDEMKRFFGRLIDVLEQFDRAWLDQKALAREPVARKGIFTDTFVTDFYRDQGEPQTAAINRGVLQLAVDRVLTERVGTTPETLPFTEQVVLSQEQATSSMKINPYMVYDLMPASLKLSPPVDFWTQATTAWTSPATREFVQSPTQSPQSFTFNEVVGTARVEAQTLREIEVTFEIEGFGAGEILQTLTFDGRNVNPGGLVADANGAITGQFTIPAGIPAGRRLLRAVGATGTVGEAIFVGEGTIDVTTMRRVTLTARAAPPPPPPVTYGGWGSSSGDPYDRNYGSSDSGGSSFTPGLGQGSGGTSYDRNGSDGSFSNYAGNDPLAQSFRLDWPRHVVGVDFKIAAIGNRSKGIRVQLCSVVNGYPSRDVLAEAYVSMATPNVGDWVEARFPAPVFLPNDREFCFVLMTDDLDHAVWIARLGDVVDLGGNQQRRVGTQPYLVGVLFSSANRSAWTAEQDADMAFRIVAAEFSQTTRSIDLWTGAFDQISDLVIRGTIELPTQVAGFRYELVRADASVTPLLPGQELHFEEYVSETVTIRAVLTGTATISPVLYPGTLILGGRLKTTGTYVTRVFDMGGAALKVTATFDAYLPGTSGITVEVDAGDDIWVPVPYADQTLIGAGWVERRHVLDPYTAVEGRVRITLSGQPWARPSIAGLRAYTI